MVSMTCLLEGKCAYCFYPEKCHAKYGRPLDTNSKTMWGSALGARSLTDEEFEQIKAEAAKTFKERTKDLYGSDEEFQRRMEVEQARLEEFSSTHKLEDEVWKPKDVVRYHRITLRFDTIQKIWDALLGTFRLFWRK
jgi:hypothetical protein